MAHRNHEWSLDGDLPILRSHSRAKHRVIYRYLTRYVDVLTSNPRVPAFKLTLVDGFAGGGRYRNADGSEIVDGSPLLMLAAMKEARASASLKRHKPLQLDTHFHFIEKNKETFDCLQLAIFNSEFRDLLSHSLHLHHGSFLQKIDPIIESIVSGRRGSRAIFVLDQFGYADVPFHVIRNIFSKLSRAEIILTFNTDALINYLTTNNTTQKILQKIGISIPSEVIKDAKQNATWKKMIQTLLHEQIYKNSGASHYTPFFIRSGDSNRDYWLVHLSNHPRARDVMVGLHWNEKNSFVHYGGAGLNMLGYDREYDSAIGGLTLPTNEFHFDKVAEESTQNQLLEDLPRRISELPEGITFDELFTQLTNESPATKNMFRECVTQLSREGFIQIFNNSGLGKPLPSVQLDSNRIILSRQRRIIFPEDHH